MPEFAPGESKTAVAPITVAPAGLSCSAEVFLGPDVMTKVATSGKVGFSSTGAEQSISLPITMPSEEGTYHVYVDVYAEGYLVAAYQAIEDVVIAAPVPPVGDFVYSEQTCGKRGFAAAPAWRQPLYSVRITNQAAAEGTRIITLHVRGTEYGDPWPGSWEGSWEQTLGPGQSVVVTARGLWPIGTFSVEFDGIPWVFGPTTVCYMHITDDVGGSTPECSV